MNTVIALPKWFMFSITERIQPHELEIESLLLVACNDEWSPSDVMDALLAKWERNLINAPWRSKQPLENRMIGIPATRRMIKLMKIDYSEIDIREYEVMKAYVKGIDWARDLPLSKQNSVGRSTIAL